jgi:cysteine-rich repeat protein
MAVFFLGSREGIRVSIASIALASIATVGCGDGNGLPDAGIDASTDDAAAEPDAGGADDAFALPDAWPRCGDGTPEGGEACDDGNRRNNDGCSITCTLECGDGRLTGDELCDTAVPSGATGSCPTSCDDGMVCTTETLVGAGCMARCASTDITLPDDTDGCCPPDATSLTDVDCPIVCGNSVLEAGELCDLGIVSGPGACPTRCDDGAVCTSDALVSAATCTARCEAIEITTPSDGDGCCPSGETVETDADCSPLCGDGVLTTDSGEVCDTGIASGADACPTSCDDGMVCTTDALVGAGTCTASCTHALLPPMNGDGCCPAGATIGTDDDCPARCGDRVRTAPEACDDGNVETGDGCSPTCTREPRAYRFTYLTIQDPRIINSSGFDVTPEANTALRNAASTDNVGSMSGGPDGFIDLSVVLRFDPLDQDAMSVPLVIDFANCTMPVATTTCAARAPGDHTATSRAMGECLGPLPGTIPVGRVVNTPSGPCFSTSEITEFSIGLGGSALRFQHTQLGAQYVGDPASSLMTGLVRGFLPEVDAMAVILGSSSLAENLRPIDRDTVDGVVGWWFYLSFVAEPVEFTYP